MFTKGQSGNPAGRPAGTRAALSRRRLLEEGPAIVEKLLTMAKAGDPTAMRLYLDRVMPALKPVQTTVQFALPEGGPTALARHVFQLVAAGELAPDEGEQLIGSLAKAVGVEQADELRSQLQTLLADKFKDIA